MLMGCLLLTGCARIWLDPNAGAESVYLRTMDHPDRMDVRYLRPASEGPIVLERRAWTFLWFIPANHPDLGLWLDEVIPEGAEAANVRASIQMPWYGPLLGIPTLGLVWVQRVRFEAQPVEWITPAGES
jgi:hypothetical protein